MGVELFFEFHLKFWPSQVPVSRPSASRKGGSLVSAELLERQVENSFLSHCLIKLKMLIDFYWNKRPVNE